MVAVYRACMSRKLTWKGTKDWVREMREETWKHLQQRQLTDMASAFISDNVDEVHAVCFQSIALHSYSKPLFNYPRTPAPSRELRLTYPLPTCPIP
jgi:hypothetical protein